MGFWGMAAYADDPLPPDGGGAPPDETVRAEDAEGCFQKGQDCYFGRGTERDYAAAAEWYRKAAEQGHAAAQCLLGVMLAEGRGGLWGSFPGDRGGRGG
ncbi:MAG: sel1 repeat family protein, partial [Kiritimatiellae bacterium]|nr:sel1 repeat family protein [Kiritimatiellia bacterium]